MPQNLLFDGKRARDRFLKIYQSICRPRNPRFPLIATGQIQICVRTTYIASNNLPFPPKKSLALQFLSQKSEAQHTITFKLHHRNTIIIHLSGHRVLNITLFENLSGRGETKIIQIVRNVHIGHVTFFKISSLKVGRAK